MDTSKGQGNISMRFFEPSIQKQDLLQMLALMYHHIQSKPDGEYTLILSIAPAAHVEMPSKLTVSVPEHRVLGEK